MIMALILIPVGIFSIISIMYKESAILKKETNHVVAEKNVTIKPQLTPHEVDNMYYRQQIGRFLVSHYGKNIKQWQPDSWFELEKRQWFVCKIYLTNGLEEHCKVWQKDQKPYKIEGVGASFSDKTNAVSKEEYKKEKERREFDFQAWIDKNTASIMEMYMSAQNNNNGSVLLPNSMLPLTLECKKIVQKNLMQTQMLGTGSSEITEQGIYFQLS